MLRISFDMSMVAKRRGALLEGLACRGEWSAGCSEDFFVGELTAEVVRIGACNMHRALPSM